MLAFIPSPSDSSFHLGPLEIHLYGLIYVVAIVLGALITARRWKAVGGSVELFYTILIWAVPAGIIGARLYFLATSWKDFRHDNWWDVFAIWHGGLGVWGAVSVGTLTALWVAHRHRANIPLLLDAAVPGLLVAHAIGRIGNYVNQELFGKPTTLPWGLEIDITHRPINYEQFATFHPTFLYEFIWDLALAAFLVWLGHHRKIKAPGLFALYITFYCFFRMFEELLRIDPSNYIFGLRWNFFMAATLFVIGAVWFWRIQTKPEKPGPTDKNGTNSPSGYGNRAIQRR